MKEIPSTPLFELYRELQFKNVGKKRKSASGMRLERAKEMLQGSGARKLAQDFEESITLAGKYFAQHDYSGEPLYPSPRERKTLAGLESTAALGCHLDERRNRKWKVRGDSDLDFYYLDRELVSTRAPGARLTGNRSTRLGPRVDLMLARASTGRPILAEVKLTSKGAPDKDPYYALIQALASAAYLLPKNQIKRLAHGQHDPRGRLDKDAGKLDLYLLIGKEPERSKYWFDLRDCAQGLAEKIAPRIAEHVSTIAGLKLDWNAKADPKNKLIVCKWFG